MNPPTEPPIVWRVHLRAAPDRVYAAWLDPGDHVHYWCERSTRTPAGFRIEFIDGTVEECAVEYTDQSRRVILRYFGSRVDIMLEPANCGTDLGLSVTKVRPSDWIASHAGWVSVLLLFKSYIDHQVDLRNHDRSRSWRHHFVDQ